MKGTQRMFPESRCWRHWRFIVDESASMLRRSRANAAHSNSEYHENISRVKRTQLRTSRHASSNELEARPDGYAVGGHGDQHVLTCREWI